MFRTTGTFFQIYENYRLFLSAKKCIFFATSLSWYGIIIKSNGYTMNPSRIEGLRNMRISRPAKELSPFVHCCSWMSLSIPNFVKRMVPLPNVLEKVHIVRKRIVRSIGMNEHVLFIMRHRTGFRGFGHTRHPAKCS